MSGLAFSDDGLRLFVSREGGIGVLDARSLQIERVLADPVLGAITAVTSPSV